MRACFYYRIYNLFCVVAPEFPYYKRCFRSYLEYELAFSDMKIRRLFKEKERFIFEIITAYAKITRLRK
jgi:hypothetical protein